MLSPRLDVSKCTTMRNAATNSTDGEESRATRSDRRTFFASQCDRTGLVMTLRIPHWQTLKPAFNPIIAKILVPWFALLPLALRVLKDVPEKIPVLAGPANFLTLSLPFKWWLLWWSSFLYTIAVTLFLIRCPGFIKKYPGYSNYIDVKHSPRWIASELATAAETLKNTPGLNTLFERFVIKELAVLADDADKNEPGTKLIEKEGTSYWFTHCGRKYKFTAKDNETPPGVTEREAFWEIFEPLATSAPNSRLATAVFLALAFVPFAVALIENIWSVLPHAAQAAWESISALYK
jgi:hypothetical protein